MVSYVFLFTLGRTKFLNNTFRWVSKRPNTSAEIKDYYHILDVKSTASPEEIKAAYLNLSKKYHPDRRSDDVAKMRFADIREAYSVLGKLDSRQEYDTDRKINALAGDTFRIHYPRPPPDLDMVGLKTYENVMRRRWMEETVRWKKAQGQYELERGKEMKPVSHTLSFIPPVTGYASVNNFLLLMTFVAGTLLYIRLTYS
ncbi:Chaperone protein isoform 3 [Schistosoma japonicum]|nr:SJCHGC04265 protein [Schistosoma japonicum]KAH8866403.1 Chaperone protein DnaJ [Schistosoma japonicum]KAH8866404.1 Chaperone protein DnaJ [Schistosoma japonicum]KAH8866407.1 Chaperone protein DnaJ [Schistosoma japonicum]TNN16164.1 Chaperone protein isoform 3 [Schistosoma japonicum]